jgi:hypothetical protein
VTENQRLPGACNRSPGSKLLSITIQLHCGGHLGGRAQLPDTILENDKNLQSDPWRIHQLEKSLTDPKHDYSKFGTGI